MMKRPFSGYFKKFAMIFLIIAITGTGGYFTYIKFFSRAYAQTNAKETTAEVVRGNLEVEISGSGTVQPIAKYDIVPLVKGNILSAPFEEGMSVKKGDLLYKIDDSDLSYNIQKAENSITKLQINHQQTVDSLNNLEVYAPVDGRLTNFTVKEGDQVSANGTIGKIIDDKHIMATIQFNKTQIEQIKVGQKAQLQIPDFMTYMDGTVRYVSNNPKPVSGGAMMYDVEIVIDNPGAIGEGIDVYGIVKTSNGDITGPFSATTAYAASNSVLAQTTGKVKQVYVKNDEWVKAGQKILTLDNSDLQSTIQKNSLDLKDSQLSLNAQKKQLNDYNILSPIDGTVIKKSYKAGDTINNGSSSTVLMTVADLTKMVFTMSVDELDVSKIALGQKVTVTADAISGSTFTGEVTKIPMEGTSSNGVTTYAVEVTISNPGKLLPGMNVKAEIQVENKSNVLYVPIAAVTKVGDKAYVSVKNGTTSGTSGKQQAADMGASPKQQNPPAEQENGQNDSQKKSGGTPGTGGGMAGYEKREVVLGINNDNYIEIISGLQEGEVVYLPAVTAGSSKTTTPGSQNMGGGGMGMPGGGPPPQ